MEYVNKQIEKQIVTSVDALKYEEIKNFFNLVNKLQLGYFLNYQKILELISLVDIYDTLSPKRAFYKEYYLNDVT